MGEKKLSEWIEENKIHATAAEVSANPLMSDMPAGSRHWEVTITGEDWNRSMVVPFSQGPAVLDDPTAEDVLDCLASDASTVENAPGFWDWLGELGYGNVSQTEGERLERTYRAVVAQADMLQQMVGKDAYYELLWEVERS